MLIKFKAHRWEYDSLARRITDLLYGSGIEAYWLEDPPKRWSLGPGNDIWLHRIQDPKDPKNPIYELHFRYTLIARAKWIALAIRDVIQSPAPEEMLLIDGF